MSFLNTPGHEPETPASILAHAIAVVVCVAAIVVWALIITF